MRAKTRSTLASGEDHQRLLDDSLLLLRSVRSTLADLLEQVVEGEAGALKDLGAKQADLEAALRRAFEAEAKWNDWQARQGGDAAGAEEIDFAALREEIGCRLARLRECCQEGA